jgi:Na+/phosphate symporter
MAILSLFLCQLPTFANRVIYAAIIIMVGFAVSIALKNHPRRLLVSGLVAAVVGLLHRLFGMFDPSWHFMDKFGSSFNPETVPPANFFINLTVVDVVVVTVFISALNPLITWLVIRRSWMNQPAGSALPPQFT